ncbi:phosphoglycerate dehydrogenase [Xanthobacter agilis]|uniref:D-3-phosphoglycerate dehydrogenase n=1 Tax=Xanthobacter agilis TaxID=47492 RepID=A0ABU0LF46_XANAG|nr:phosphoglycerate dehydrogenase [Xanthobacter agilis]MDQ0505697.1 D-3-phosphoglycerate dehydrogenase [Xanthobacter agilis]
MAPSPKVLVTTRLFDDAATHHLVARGCTVVPSGLAPDALDTDISDADLDRLLDGAAGWIVGQRAVTRAVLARHPGLKVIARRGVGYDRVDVAAAEDLGRVVTIAAGANDAAVADHTLALMLAVLRRLRESAAALAAGDWRVVSGSDLYGKTVGLVGFGRIARQVARRLHGFDVRVLVETPRPDFAAAGVTYVTLPELLASSDVVSLHAPLGPTTLHLLNGETLGRMKPGAVVVNTARGGLIDDAALLVALAAGRLGGAGLDVFEAETDPALRPVAEALVARPDVVASAHAAGSSREALARGNMISAHCVIAALLGEEMPAGCLVVDGR